MAGGIGQGDAEAPSGTRVADGVREVVMVVLGVRDGVPVDVRVRDDVPVGVCV